MSFLKKLFGGGSDGGAAAAAKSAEYKGFTIEARPYKEGGQFQLAGVIAKEIDGVRKEHKFVRADRFTWPRRGDRVRAREGPADHRRARRQGVQLRPTRLR